MTLDEGKDIVNSVSTAIDDSIRLRALYDLCGTHQSGTAQDVFIDQEEGLVYITVGEEEIASGVTLEAALDELVKKQSDE